MESRTDEYQSHYTIKNFYLQRDLTSTEYNLCASETKIEMKLRGILQCAQCPKFSIENTISVAESEVQLLINCKGKNLSAIADYQLKYFLQTIVSMLYRSCKVFARSVAYFNRARVD